MNFNEVQALQYMVDRLVKINFKGKRYAQIIFKYDNRFVTFNSYECSDNVPIETKFLNNGKNINKYPVNVMDNKANNLFYRAYEALTNAFPNAGDPLLGEEQITNMKNDTHIPYLLIKLIDLVKSLKLDAPTSTQVAYDFNYLNNKNDKLPYFLIDKNANFEPVYLTTLNQNEE
ncbi:hypothetical protein [Fructilactobacillus fructivorans]|uniref:Uncharacterized protein n=1 Tax=Fructilactobacillus fructivorans TaxID=1614 RepID=A0AAE6P1B2_9LACO|nr:hypothetical protein [Fructilactobacillus fructivorans]KRK58483.1 hypothetical protein FC73_GL000034 [Fructilactobacillus fructivorans]KRN13325.1 hypothetical protein IV37_GL000037 [Fructilactobacillus fructivorans]QFX92492.1 hypothetical protein LF543_02505 [Fructilactobacillus fructivorans]RDV65912.1 hypothetical protein DXU76_01905 [Fructilactobacillus fructivorans]